MVKVKISDYKGKFTSAKDPRTIKTLLEKFNLNCDNNEFELAELIELVIKHVQETQDNRKRETKEITDISEAELSPEDFETGGYVHLTDPMKFKLYWDGYAVNIKARREDGSLMNVSRVKKITAELFIDLLHKLNIEDIWEAAVNIANVENPDALLQQGRDLEFDIKSYLLKHIQELIKELENADDIATNSILPPTVEDLVRLGQKYEETKARLKGESDER